MKKVILITVTVLGLLWLVGCGQSGQSGNKADSKASEASLKAQQKSQPTPIFDFSQYRQNLIEIVTAQAEVTQTTSFFFLEGVGLVGSCPSIGFPIASTTQLTNPESKNKNSDVVLPQVEPTGVYTGPSTGTYTICVSDKGKAYASYFEGYVQTVTGPASFVNGQVELTGKPTGGFTKGG